MTPEDGGLLRRVEWCAWRVRGGMDVGPGELRSLCASIRAHIAGVARPEPELLAALDSLASALNWASESIGRELSGIGARRRAMRRFAVLHERPGRRLAVRA